jgi:hypothetical protein
MHDQYCGIRIPEFDDLLAAAGGGFLLYCPDCGWHGEPNTAYAMVGNKSQGGICGNGCPYFYRVYENYKRPHANNDT